MMNFKMRRKFGASAYSLFLIASILVIQIFPATATTAIPSIEAETTTTTEPALSEDELNDSPTTEQAEGASKEPRSDDTQRLFVVELLKMLHEQYHGFKATDEIGKKEDRQLSSNLSTRQAMLSQLLSAIGADGDMRRLVDWVQNSFNLASIGELTTQFVVSKLGSVNCAAILKPDNEESLIPRFLLFNDHFVDVPFELPLQPSPTECLANGRFDPQRKTVILIHGYLTGYTLVDGLTNIKNRLLDTNKLVTERAAKVIEQIQEASGRNTTRLFMEDIEMKLKQQQYNVIIVDWFNGANPVPRSRYIRAAVNAQVVGQLIARFLSQMVSSCKTPAQNIQIIAHSLGCHVAGFTGKAMTAMGHRLGKITHLDPVGLCFGRLFSEPRFRLSPNDAIETRAVHVSLNLFDNPLDGAQSNFLVNGGRDQIGCGGQSELRNSTSSSIALLFDNDTKFRPCSHVRALALFEDDVNSEPGQCQVVGYRCPTYERFLAGKCGRCDAMNGQCRLMSLPPIIANFKTVPIANHRQSSPSHSSNTNKQMFADNNSSVGTKYSPLSIEAANNDERVRSHAEADLLRLVNSVSNGSIAWLIDDRGLNQKIVSTIAKMNPGLIMDGKGQEQSEDNNRIRRSDRSLSSDHRDKLVQTIVKLRSETRNALADGFLGLRGVAGLTMASEQQPQMGKYKSLGRLRGKQQQQPVARPVAANFDQLLSESELVLQTDPTPLGGQANPEGSVNMPIYFVGTGPISPYCVNYYQFRMLIAESRIKRLLKTGNLAPNRQAQVGAFATSIGNSLLNQAQRQATNPKDTLHLTVKLTDSEGHFFKGFTMVEDALSLVRVPSESRPTLGASENMIELTMLLNTTRSEPIHISESIVSFYFHGIVLADTIEINYMSNISPL